jgi:hypothetical protein
LKRLSDGLENQDESVVLITSGEDQKIKFWSMQMKLLFSVDLRTVNSPSTNNVINRSACSLDIFCCHEPKDYLRGKTKGMPSSFNANENKSANFDRENKKNSLKSKFPF